MTKEKFDNYKFSIKTEISIQNNCWDNINEVDFFNRTISINGGQICKLDEILDIRN